jgi:hypothetical protein
MPAKRKAGNTRNTGIKNESGRVKTTFSLDPRVVEKLRGVAWYSRESLSEIVERLITEYVGAPKFRNVPQRPAKRT